MFPYYRTRNVIMLHFVVLGESEKTVTILLHLGLIIVLMFLNAPVWRTGSVSSLCPHPPPTHRVEFHFQNYVLKTSTFSDQSYLAIHRNHDFSFKGLATHVFVFIVYIA